CEAGGITMAAKVKVAQKTEALHQGIEGERWGSGLSGDRVTRGTRAPKDGEIDSREV
ncbi:hypothetical protein KI387_042081, partial [Taxus chinensis]